MLSMEFHNVAITGLACAVPDNRVYSDSYIDVFGEATVERFKSATGIESRYMSDGKQTISDLSYVAAQALFEKKGLTGEDFDAVILITQTPDYRTPSTSFLLHERLGIKKDCLVFDINLGCSGYVNGIYVVAGMIECGMINRALLLVGDSETNHRITEDTSFTMMFGDAASATIMERGSGMIRGLIRSDGDGYNMLMSPVPGARFPGILSEDGSQFQSRMNGDDVFLFTITKVPKLFNEFYKTFNCDESDFDYFVFHQANLMIINQIAKKLKLPSEKVPISLHEYGNTEGASIPVSIVDVCSKNDINKKLKLITSGFGIGLSWGVVSFEIDSNDIIPMIVTDDYYEEGKNV